MDVLNSQQRKIACARIMDAMPDGGRLIVEGCCDEQRLNLSVQDTGIGISQDLHEKVFEPFFSTKEEGRGTGLGLSICQGLVRSHGGRITVHSQPGVGSRFVVTMPIMTDAPCEGAGHG